MTALATDSGRKTPARLASGAILACQSDDRLVQLVRTGHERAFDAIVQRYRKPLVGYCKRILPESRCEDAVQQAFINAHAALIDSDDPIQLKPWLYAITRNAALNMLRQNGWNYEQIPLDFDGVRRPDQVFEQRIELQQTVAALNELPERQRDALVMREFEGRSYDEIALALGANDGAVRQLLNRARVTLRNAASLLTPPPLVARAAASMPPADGRRAAELFAGLGAAGVAKAGATALVAGTLVVGAVKAPLPLTDHGKPTTEKASLAPAKLAADDTSSAHDTPIAQHTPPANANRRGGHGPSAPAARHGQRHSSNSGPGSQEHHGTREREPERHSGSGGDDRSGSRDRSGSDDSPTSGSGDHSGTSGGSGSDDGVTILSGSDDSSTTSGTSGDGTSGTSGSGESTSGTSGTSGSDDFSTSGTSGSSGSSSGETTTTTTTTSGSGTSGSGSGTSGSSDSLEH